MYKLFLFVLVLLLSVVASLSIHVDASDRLDVAVCITGQVARLQPQFLIDNFINANPEGFHFHVYLILQPGEKAKFNTETGYEPTKYALQSHHKLKTELKIMYHTNHSTVRKLHFVKPFSKLEWKYAMGYQELNRITLYKKGQDTILNMYNKQVKCAKDIANYERETGKNFSLVINTREDAYFFQPMNLTGLYNQYILDQGCGIVTKSCLAWGGVNMRFQVYDHNSGLAILSERVSFYKSLYTTKSSVVNPESYEKLQLSGAQVKSCAVPVEFIPVCAARHTSKGEVCFIPQEIGCDKDKCSDACFPSSSTAFLMTNICK